MVRQVFYRLLVLHASISNKVPDCIQPIGCSNDLTVRSEAHVEFHLSCPPIRIQWTREKPKQKETNAMPLLCRSSSSDIGKLMIGRKGLRRNTKAKIAICTFRKLNWMHWVDFNLPHQNPHFSSFLTQSDALLGKSTKSIWKIFDRFDHLLDWTWTFDECCDVSNKIEKCSTDIVTSLTIIWKSFHFTFLLHLRNFVEQCTFGSDKIRFCYEWMCGHISVSWMECVVAVVDVVVDVGLRHRYGLLTILHFDKAHATPHHTANQNATVQYIWASRQWMQPNRRRFRFNEIWKS